MTDAGVRSVISDGNPQLSGGVLLSMMSGRRFALAVAVAVLLGCSSSGSGKQALETATTSTSDPAVPAVVATAAAALAANDRDKTPTSAAYYPVLSRRKAVFVLSQGDISGGNTPGYAIALRGNFTQDVRGTAGARPAKGHFAYAFVDKASGEIQDDGVSDAEPDLSPLGRPVNFACCR
jgi:hypothetical protein